MATLLDQYGNYSPSLEPLAAVSPSSGFGRLRFGSGEPDAGLGNVGDAYVDTVTNIIYSKGVSGWLPGASGSVLSDAFADPNGNITPSNTGSAAFYYQDGVGDVNNYWRWSVDDQVWYQLGGP